MNHGFNRIIPWLQLWITDRGQLRFGHERVSSAMEYFTSLYFMSVVLTFVQILTTSYPLCLGLRSIHT